MKNTIVRDGPIPLYYQLERIISEEIENGNYPMGSVIPTEKELSEMFSVSRTTVRQAIVNLVHEGKLYRVKSKGTFVKKQKISQNFGNNHRSFCAEVSKIGGVSRTSVLKVEKTIVPANIAYEAKANPNDEVIFLSRILYADNTPIVKSDTYLWKVSFEEFLQHNFIKEAYGDILASNPLTALCRTLRTCEACTANPLDEELLNAKLGSPILYTQAFGYNKDDDLIEYTVSRHRGDCSKFTAEFYNTPQ